MNSVATRYNAIISSLKERYDALSDLSERDFFICIADYIQYVNQTPEIAQLIISIDQERIELEKRLNELQVKVGKDKKRVAAQVLKAIKKKRISFPELDEAIKEYEHKPSDYMDLVDIIGALYRNGYKDLVADFVETDKSGEMRDFKISDHYKEFMDVYEMLLEGHRSAIWGALRDLEEVFQVVHIQKKLRDYIRARKFTKDQYSNQIFRVHNFILNKLLEEYVPLQELNNPEINTPSFNKETNELQFLGKVIKFHLDSKEKDLCSIVFKSSARRKEWMFIDILDLLKESVEVDEGQRMVLYRAGRRINEKVAKTTLVKDLLVLTTKSIRINPKYLQ